MSARKIECPVYRPTPESRRCVDFVDGGACARPDIFMCTEWVAANQRSAPRDGTRGESTRAETAGSGEPRAAEVAQPAAPRSAASSCTRGAQTVPHPSRSGQGPLPETPPRVLAVRTLTTEELDSFRALGVSVCVRSDELGEVWIVPEYTTAERSELRVDHAATLAALCAAFPGARAVAFERRK